MALEKWNGKGINNRNGMLKVTGVYTGKKTVQSKISGFIKRSKK